MWLSHIIWGVCSVLFIFSGTLSQHLKHKQVETYSSNNRIVCSLKPNTLHVEKHNSIQKIQFQEPLPRRTYVPVSLLIKDKRHPGHRGTCLWSQQDGRWGSRMESESSLGYLERPCLRTTRNKGNNRNTGNNGNWGKTKQLGLPVGDFLDWILWGTKFHPKSFIVGKPTANLGHTFW